MHIQRPKGSLARKSVKSTTILFLNAWKLGYDQEPVSGNNRNLFNKINLTTDKECSQISILGISVILKENQPALGNETLFIRSLH